MPTNLTTSPALDAACAVATNVNDGTITSLPAGNLKQRRSISIPMVQFVVHTTCLTPTSERKLSSNFRTMGPLFVRYRVSHMRRAYSTNLVFVWRGGGGVYGENARNSARRSMKWGRMESNWCALSTHLENSPTFGLPTWNFSGNRGGALSTSAKAAILTSEQRSVWLETGRRSPGKRGNGGDLVTLASVPGMHVCMLSVVAESETNSLLLSISVHRGLP